MTFSDKSADFSSAQVYEVLSLASLCTDAPSGEAGALKKRISRSLESQGLLFEPLTVDSITDENNRAAKQLVLESVTRAAQKKRHKVVFSQIVETESGHFHCYNDTKGTRRWQRLPSADFDVQNLLNKLVAFEQKNVVLVPAGRITKAFRRATWRHGEEFLGEQGTKANVAMSVYSHSPAEIHWNTSEPQELKRTDRLSHLDKLEAESIHIIREVISQSDNPVMLYSVGKDSAVMLHLARKAFYPSPPPFPLLHVDTRWKFKAMYDFRQFMADESGMELLVHINPEGVAKNINPFDHGSALHTDVMKTQSLKMALDHYKFDVAFGGARRDEEKSRAKERIFSFRTATHSWDAKNQRPELWNLYNGRKSPGESIRVFPISNWTELDIWQYIYREQIPIVPLYFAQERPCIERDGMIMMVDDDRLPIFPDEEIKFKKIRFRTLGCYPLTGAIESEADDLASIVLELLDAKTSERQGRAIDSDSSASMEKKKQEGYF